jgi:hypothetical protein
MSIHIGIRQFKIRSVLSNFNGGGCRIVSHDIISGKIGIIIFRSFF